MSEPRRVRLEVQHDIAPGPQQVHGEGFHHCPEAQREAPVVFERVHLVPLEPGQPHVLRDQEGLFGRSDSPRKRTLACADLAAEHVKTGTRQQGFRSFDHACILQRCPLSGQKQPSGSGADPAQEELPHIRSVNGRRQTKSDIQLGALAQDFVGDAIAPYG